MSAFDHDGRALKVASFRLVKAVGGEKNAAGITGTSTSVVQRKADRNSGERWFNVRELLELEAHAPAPLVTQALCRAAHGVFVPLPEGEAGDGPVTRTVMEIAAELGDVSRDVTAALADDGEIDASEAEAALADVVLLEAKAAELRVALERIAGRGVIPLRPRATLRQGQGEWE